MVLVLVLGDLHIPYRSHDLPAKFKKLLVPGKISQILSTGNITDRETWDYLRTVAPDLRGVKGDSDESTQLPPSMVVQHGPLRIGVIHGHQVVPLGDPEMLAATARKMDVDVLVSGGTHRFEAFESDNRFFLNPGSATGAFSPLWTPPPPPPPPPASEAAPPASTNETASSTPTDSSNPQAQSSDRSKQAGSSPAVDAASDSATTARTPSGSTNDPAGPGSTTTREGQAGNGTRDADPVETGPTPSFALLDIQGNVVVTYVYTEKNGDVSVEKMEFRKHVA
ncbi:hypothetical protein JCM10212_003290 [Sporobolomyces blumeae]